MKTPWNPSKTATARVKDPLPTPTTCNCCGSPDVEIVNNSAIYNGKSYGDWPWAYYYGDWPWAYYCAACDAYVGLHPFTAIPLGTLADRPTREARTKAKPYFERLFGLKLLSHTEAYARLAQELGLSVSECHFGLFTVEQCAAVRPAVDRIREAF